MRSDVDTRLRMGVDIGGTFTDLAVVDARGLVAVAKLPTTPDDPAEGVRDVIGDVVARGLDPTSIHQFVHGTTLVTNTLLERTGSRVALFTTEGFRDVLEMRREHRYELYDLAIQLPTPLVPRHLRFDVPERILADGTVAVPLDVRHVERLTSELWSHGVESIAIAFLHSPIDPTHELAARDAIHRVAPNMRVSISSEVMSDIREFERTSTVVANLYVQQRVDRYLDDLTDVLDQLDIPAPPLVMLSNGGTATVETATRVPIRMLESGPAGGALAAAAIATDAAIDSVLAFDMGGTTAKICVVEGGRPLVTHRFEVDRAYRLKPGSGLPVNVPVIDMIEIGVGGGSIARPDALGLVAVGPKSAGADPGPACYGRGGRRATVTDAAVVLGYIHPDSFLGGRMPLDASAAARAISDDVAQPLGMSVEAAAWAIHRTANEGMANAARVHAVERGADPSRLPLFAYGGAGPMHGAGVAGALGCRRVIVPARAGVVSAMGFLAAPLAFDFVRPAHVRVTDMDVADAERKLRRMEDSGREVLLAAGVNDADISHRRTAEMRFVGQGHTIGVEVPDTLDRDGLAEEFRNEYRSRYRREGPAVEPEIITWRVVSSGPTPELQLRRALEPGDGAPNVARTAYFGDAGGFVETDVRTRSSVSPGTDIDGPVIIEEDESTVVVPPGDSVSADDTGVLWIEIGTRR